MIKTTAVTLSADLLISKGCLAQIDKVSIRIEEAIDGPPREFVSLFIEGSDFKIGEIVVKKSELIKAIEFFADKEK